MPLLIPETAFVLKSTLSEINIATLAFFRLVFVEKEQREEGGEQGLGIMSTSKQYLFPNYQCVCLELCPVEETGFPALTVN